ncbi:DNA primase [Chlamydia sp. 17-3921]|uniref:DNA primase n=1 Tax=Chlamydia sp. 17-3921 TaxID=2675798 RepID=UPI00191AF4C4|nr:DNA primase [Chlamydia sp. 17-3921]
MYTDQSLDNLRHSIDIVDVLSDHIHLKRSGATYKACCPFHTEKTPSFIINPAGAYYHCFGCGAHGDAIAFLMQYFGYSFTEAVLVLAKKFHVELDIVSKESGVSASIGVKEELRNINYEAEKFFRYCLFHLPEGIKAMQYLYQRGFSPDTIDRFCLGYAPEQSVFLLGMQDKKFTQKQLKEAGFFGGKWFLFSKRIIFPIHDALGYTLGFSSRKFLENVQGSKYVNTPETILFKKSRILYGLNFSRRRISKEKRVILVEGQVDCLQMIDSGFNCTLAVQGTAFTEDHVKELSKLGVLKVFLLFDNDDAGNKAALRIGDMCQAAGMAVFVCHFPEGEDPDIFLMRRGSCALIDLLEQSESYLAFLISEKIKTHPNFSPQEKALIVEDVVRQVKRWGNPILVYEHMKQLASLMMIPEEMVFALVQAKTKVPISTITAKQKVPRIHTDIIIETDVLRCMLFSKTSELFILHTAKSYLSSEDFKHSECRKLFSFLIDYYESHRKNAPLEEAIAKLSDSMIINLLTKRRLNTEILSTVFVQALRKLADRQWRERNLALVRQKQELGEKLSVLKDYVQIYKDRTTIDIIYPDPEEEFSSQ